MRPRRYSKYAGLRPRLPSDDYLAFRPAAGSSSSGGAEDPGSGLNEILPRVYGSVYAIVGLAFVILALGFVLLYRKKAPVSATAPPAASP